MLTLIEKNKSASAHKSDDIHVPLRAQFSALLWFGGFAWAAPESLKEGGRTPWLL